MTSIQNKTVYAIIVTYNGSKWIEKCISSLLNSVVPIRIFVIDNCSTDNTLQLVRDKFGNVDQVVLIENERNLGFGKANNIGMRIACADKADYVLLVNQDTYLNQQNVVERLIQISETHKEYGILSPFHFAESPSTLERQFSEFLSYKYVDMFVSDLYFGKLKEVYTTNYIHAAFWLLPLSVIEEVGVFDPLFDHYGEDDDFMARLTNKGYLMGLVPSVSITHDAVYKTWDMLEWNEGRNYIVALNMLKRMNPSFRSNVLLYAKTTFDQLTSYLVFRKFKKFRFSWKIMLRVIKNYRSIKQSHKKSFERGAFIQE